MLNLSRSRRLLRALAARAQHDLKTRPRATAYSAAAALTFVLAFGSVASLRARPASSPNEANQRVAHAPPAAEIVPPERRRFPSRESVGASRPGATVSRPAVEGPGVWWVGTAGVAFALAAVGWGSVAARRYLPQGAGPGPTPMRVVGRTSLSPKHTVYLLDVGGRVLILGAGPQGAPSLIGELDPSTRFDRRLGDET